MNEAAPQPATAMTEEDAKALEVLQLLWVDEYSIGYDAEKVLYWATPNGVMRILTASSVEELGKMVEDDNGGTKQQDARLDAALHAGWAVRYDPVRLEFTAARELSTARTLDDLLDAIAAPR
jgi:hypothetical protein